MTKAKTTGLEGLDLVKKLKSRAMAHVKVGCVACAEVMKTSNGISVCKKLARGNLRRVKW